MHECVIQIAGIKTVLYTIIPWKKHTLNTQLKKKKNVATSKILQSKFKLNIIEIRSQKYSLFLYTPTK